ncbi:MAG: CDP-alcohol phosphatidyltransferase family protein [Candidatus Odinarchaeia archaeon]
MLGKLREKYQKMMAPVGEKLAEIGLTANMLTFISLIVAIIGGVFFAYNYLIIGVIFILLTAFIDMLDGSVARASGGGTRFGAVFDHTLDRFAEFALIFGLGFSIFVDMWVAFLTLFLMVMASFIRAKAESVGKLEKCTVGIAERQEKLILIIVGAVLTAIFPTVFLLGFSIIEICLLIVAVLSLITVIQRLHYTWMQTGGK